MKDNFIFYFSVHTETCSFQFRHFRHLTSMDGGNAIGL